MNNRIVAFLLLTLAWPVDSRAQDDVLSWFVQVEGAAQNSAQPRTFRLFEETDTVAIQLTLDNESRRPVVISSEQLAAAARITVTDLPDRRVAETVVEWAPCTVRLTASGAPAIAGDPLRLASGEPVSCQARVRRADGSRFRWGMYAVTVSLASAAESLRDESGGRWPGRFLPHTDLTLVVQQAIAKTEIAGQHLLVGDAALKANRPHEAIAHYRAGLAAHPTDLLLLGGLGRAYLETSQYREAAAVYEQLVPALEGKRSGILSFLVYAYVGAGDEHRAREVLAKQGVSDERISAELARIRELQARKSRKIR